MPPADVMVYTSALEHLPRDRGPPARAEPLQHLPPTAFLLVDPDTPMELPRLLQHGGTCLRMERWELRTVLKDAGLTVKDAVGCSRRQRR